MRARPFPLLATKVRSSQLNRTLSHFNLTRAGLLLALSRRRLDRLLRVRAILLVLLQLLMFACEDDARAKTAQGNDTFRTQRNTRLHLHPPLQTKAQ